MELAALTMRFLLALLLLTVGWSKIPRRREFQQTVWAYRLLPDRTVPMVAAGILGAELGIGILLALGLGVRVAAGASALLLLAFALAMALSLGRGRRIDCGCSATPHEISWTLVVRNLLLAAASALVAAGGATALSLDRLIFHNYTQTSSATAVAVLIASATAYAAASTLREGFRLRRLLLVGGTAR